MTQSHKYSKNLRQVLESNQIDHKKEVLKESTLKDAHSYCIINSLNGQLTGPILENFIIEKNNIKKNMASECTGDCSKNGENIEIKCSNGGKTHNKFNYVQIRMNHKYDYVIFTAYHLTQNNFNNGGELFIFKIYKSCLADLIVEHGGYAHGTKNKHGKITSDSVKKTDNDKEYALRPTYGNALWKKLLKFRITEAQI